MALFDPFDQDLSGQLCPECQQFKPWNEYYRKSRRCKKCVIVQTMQDRREIPGWGAIRQAASRARKNNLPFELYGHKEELFARFLSGCELTGLPFNFERRGKGGKWDSPSIDRIEPSKGYVLSNVRVILYCLNAAFNNWGEDQFEIVARAWLEKRK